jgi:Uma2 family endonuclease
MTSSHDAPSRAPDETIRHVRPPRPIRFPSEAEVPEGKRHYELRTFLYRLLKLAFADRACVGCDQFVYWNARSPKRCLSPDGFVYLGAADRDFKSWKTWERGTPQLAVEIVSDPGTEIFDWDRRYEAYLELGVAELVRFDPDAEPGKRIAVWDRIDDDLVERVVEGDATPCLTLGLYWRVAPVEGYPVGLRLTRDEAGEDLLPTPDEVARRDADAARRDADAARLDAGAARREADAARARIAELEAELAKRGG